jgi:hypothetical protein
MSFEHDLDHARDRIVRLQSQLYHSDQYGDIEYKVVGHGPPLLYRTESPAASIKPKTS